MSGQALIPGTLKQMGQFAQSKVGLLDWQVYQWTAADGGGSIVVGCVPNGVYSKGARKGQPRFRDPLPDTKRTVVIADRELSDYLRQRETDTGQCSRCEDHAGKEWAGWNKEEGTKYRQCYRCNGTGVAP